MSRIDGGLRALFRENLKGFDLASIESGTTGSGIPDMNYCVRASGLTGVCDYGIEGWIEFKQTKGWAVTLRPEQVGWILRRVRAGGRVWVAVRQVAPAGPRAAQRDALWLVPGRLAREARVGGLRALYTEGAAPPVLVWHGGPARWDWDAVAALLAS